MIIQLKLKTPSFYNKTLLRHPVILRSLVATYRVIIDQNPSGILKSEPIGPGKWVVENFDCISSGLLNSILLRLKECLSLSVTYFSQNTNIAHLLRSENSQQMGPAEWQCRYEVCKLFNCLIFCFAVWCTWGLSWV